MAKKKEEEEEESEKRVYPKRQIFILLENSSNMYVLNFLNVDTNFLRRVIQCFLKCGFDILTISVTHLLL